MVVGRLKCVAGSWVFIGIFISTSVQADETAVHWGTLIGNGSADSSGDSPYHPLNWCGNLLWADDDQAVSLIDPVSKRRVRTLHRISGEGFITCQQLGDRTIAWTDRWDYGLALYSIGTWQVGRITGVARAELRGNPLIDFDDGIAIALASNDHPIVYDNLPAGLRVVSIDPKLISPAIEAAKLRVEEHSEDARLVDIALLNRRFLALVLDRPFPTDGGGWAQRFGAVTILEVSLNGSAASVGRYWSIDDELHLGHEDEIRGVSATASGVTIKIERKEGTQTCDMIISSKATQFTCEPVADVEKADTDRAMEIIDGQAPGRWGFIAESPSGRWVAWTESGSTGADPGAVNFYFAPTADLLKPE